MSRDLPDGVRIRPYQESTDSEGVETVRAAVAEYEHAARPDPCDGSGLVALASDTVIGYSHGRCWTEVDGTRLHLVLGTVTPAWRRRGVGSALLVAQEHRAALADPGGPGTPMWGANADANRRDARALLLDHGYRIAFTVVDLACDPARVPAAPVRLPAGLELREVEDAAHPRVHAAIEECFAVSRTGQLPFPYEEYLRDVDRHRGDLGLWQVAWAGAEVAGLAIAAREDGTVADTPWVAVRPGWRRVGLGRVLVRRGLLALAAAGVRTARISTVAENPNHAAELYAQEGYRVVRRIPRYRKPMVSAGQ